MEYFLSDRDILEKSMVHPYYFEMLVDRYQEAFLRKSMSIVHSKEEAEDIVQETFLRIYKSGKNFKDYDDASFKSWAYQILKNTTFSHYKNQKKRQARVRQVDFANEDFEDTTMPSIVENQAEKRSYVEKILKKMPESLAHVLRLYFLEEKSQKEIARIEHISPGAVRVRIHRAKNFFKKISLQPL